MKALQVLYDALILFCFQYETAEHICSFVNHHLTVENLVSLYLMMIHLLQFHVFVPGMPFSGQLKENVIFSWSFCKYVWVNLLIKAFDCFLAFSCSFLAFPLKGVFLRPCGILRFLV